MEGAWAFIGACEKIYLSSWRRASLPTDIFRVLTLDPCIAPHCISLLTSGFQSMDFHKRSYPRIWISWCHPIYLKGSATDKNIHIHVNTHTYIYIHVYAYERNICFIIIIMCMLYHSRLESIPLTKQVSTQLLPTSLTHSSWLFRRSDFRSNSLPMECALPHLHMLMHTLMYLYAHIHDYHTACFKTQSKLF